MDVSHLPYKPIRRQIPYGNEFTLLGNTREQYPFSDDRSRFLQEVHHEARPSRSVDNPLSLLPAALNLKTAQPNILPTKRRLQMPRAIFALASPFRSYVHRTSSLRTCPDTTIYESKSLIPHSPDAEHERLYSPSTVTRRTETSDRRERDVKLFLLPRRPPHYTAHAVQHLALRRPCTVFLHMRKKIINATENRGAFALYAAEDAAEGRVHGRQGVFELDVALEEELPAVEDAAGAVDTVVDALLAVGVFGHAALEVAFLAFPEGGRVVEGAGAFVFFEGFLLFADL